MKDTDSMNTLAHVIIRFIFLALLGLLPVTALAKDAGQPLPHYVLVPERSKLKFVAIRNGAPTEGAFRSFSADIRFDPDDLAHSSITAEVDISSLFTAEPELAAQLLAADWFDMQHYPKATLRTKVIKMMPDPNPGERHYNYYADCELTIRDKTVPVEMDFVLENLDSKGAVATGRISLWRRNFGVGQGKWQTIDEVEDVVGVKFRITAKRLQE